MISLKGDDKANITKIVKNVYPSAIEIEDNKDGFLNF